MQAYLPACSPSLVWQTSPTTSSVTLPATGMPHLRPSWLPAAFKWGVFEADRSKKRHREEKPRTWSTRWVTCLAASLDGEVKNVEHGLADDADKVNESASEALVSVAFCDGGGGVNCCCSSCSRRLSRRSLVAARRRKSDGILLPGLRGGSAARPASGVGSLAGAEGAAEPICSPGEGKAKKSLRAGLRGGIRDGMEDAAKPPVAVEPMGVSGCCLGDGDAKKEGPPLVVVLVGVSGGGAANTKPPFAVGPVAVGAKNVQAPLACCCPNGAENDRPLRASDPPGVPAEFPMNAKMFPGETGGSITRGAVWKENSLVGEGGGGGPALEAVGEGEGIGGGGGVEEEGAGAMSKGASSSSILLRTEAAGTRQRRLPLAAPQGAEKDTAEGAVSMRSSARCRGGGVRKKACGSAAAMASGSWSILGGGALGGRAG